MRPFPWSALARSVAIAALIVACDSTTDSSSDQSIRPLGPGERWLPVARWDLPDGRRILCAGGGTIGDFEIHGSPTDPRLAWMIDPSGARRELAFDPGWSARFTPELEVLDVDDHVVARDGSRVTGRCSTAERGVDRPEF